MKGGEGRWTATEGDGGGMCVHSALLRRILGRREGGLFVSVKVDLFLCLKFRVSIRCAIGNMYLELY